ncbi:MAG: asparagine synthase (glutamine-hydrolyzing) [Flavobacteriales bacterium]
MCGIFGAINTAKINTNEIKSALFHRGPDAQEFIQEDNVFLYHFRLSILDLEGGKQPMSYKHFHIIWNGEIYNHQDLRKKYNLKCTTSSDTETLLHLFDLNGLDMFQDLEGMFALAIYDSKNKKVILSRDRAGKKPLYYFSKDKTFVFASEYNALNAQCHLEINEQALYEYIEPTYFYKEATPYLHTHTLNGGDYIEYDTEKHTWEKHTWWDISTFYNKKSKDTFNEALNKTDELLRAAIKRRLDSSDLEVASFLSGGIDSGLVTAIASEYYPKLKTFTVAFEGTFDESGLAEQVAAKYNTDHHTIHISFDDLENDIEDIILQYGFPFFDTSCIPSYYVAKEAKKYVTVVLNGDGADELFGGYRRSVPYAKFDFFKENKLVEKSAKLINTMLPTPKNKRSKYNYIYRLTDLASQKGVAKYFASTYDLYSGFEDQALVKRAVNKQFLDDFNRINSTDNSGLSKLLEFDFIGPLFGDLLVKMDMATMHNSLEGRSPFLAKDLLEYIPTIDDSFKIKGTTTKYILRELAKKYLPETIISQPKRGFEIPLKDWVNGVLKNKIESYLFADDVYWVNFVKEDFFNKIYHRQIDFSEERRAKIIYQLFVLELWHKKR